MDIEGLLSNSAWAVLDQLAKGNVWDGDLVSKSGRTELIQKGYAKRDRRDERGLMINELTASGRDIAIHYCSDGGRA
jgi:hypothetical protein